MKLRVVSLWPCALAALAGAALDAAAQTPAARSLDAYAQPALKDVRVEAKVVSKSDRELSKIGRGFVDAYRLKDQEISYKEPGRVRFEAKWGLFTIRRVTNGDRQLFTAPGHRKLQDISKEPGKGDSISDMGVITPSWLAQVEAEWQRAEPRDGKTLQVFEVRYKQDPGVRHMLWIDPATKTIVEHVSHHRNRRKPGFKKRLVYAEPKQINGVWVPTQASIYNGENILAAVMRYERIQVNSGLRDGLFNF